MSIANLSAKTLQRAAKIRSQIDRLELQLAKLLGSTAGRSTSNGSSPAKKRGRRKMSAASRAKIAAAQRRRWKAQKAASN
jgi:hypothetical protein